VTMSKLQFLIVAGLILLGLGVWEFSRAMRMGGIELRDGTLIARECRPGIFWANTVGQIVVACGGIAPGLWQLTQDGPHWELPSVYITVPQRISRAMVGSPVCSLCICSTKLNTRVQNSALS
jgi:hypothetical protein